MNYLKLKIPFKILCTTVLVSIMILAGCSNKVMFNTSRVVPAAEGYVKITKDDNGNKVVNIEIKRLTQPTRLQPSRDVYVVWMDTKDNGLKNIGQLRTNSSFFSSELKSSFSAITPFNPSKVFITAENDANIVRPSGVTVLSTDRL